MCVCVRVGLHIYLYRYVYWLRRMNGTLYCRSCGKAFLAMRVGMYMYMYMCGYIMSKMCRHLYGTPLPCSVGFSYQAGLEVGECRGCLPEHLTIRILPFGCVLSVRISENSHIVQFNLT